jgi:hypothetical protein
LRSKFLDLIEQGKDYGSVNQAMHECFVEGWEQRQQSQTVGAN